MRAPMMLGLAVLLASIPAHAQKVAPDTTDQGPEIPKAQVTIELDGGAKATCNEHAAQPFLIRKNWFARQKEKDGNAFANESLKKAIDYRTEKYGHFPGYGDGRLNKFPPAHYAKSVSFMGLTLQVNERIIPALKCVEAALKATKVADEYHPRSIGGIRFKNTYRGSEISNHVYGIAIDIESDRNTCCSCVDPWPNHPLCKKKVASIYERMAMPRSWVVVFERYGFYWLGHDALQDTMHFEYLGDPDKILKGKSDEG